MNRPGQSTRDLPVPPPTITIDVITGKRGIAQTRYPLSKSQLG